jgi:hypothetical protein
VVAPITVADLVNFDPTSGSHRMEPDGWSIIGLETNFFVTAGVEVQAGELVGLPASVRFTPAAYHWDYGDGTAATLLQAGAPWVAEGVREFDPTPTSHAFTAAGRVTITLTVDYSAEYSFDGSEWVPIVGVVPVVADTLSATVSDASTLLVGSGCSDTGSGLGC